MIPRQEGRRRFPAAGPVLRTAFCLGLALLTGIEGCRKPGASAPKAKEVPEVAVVRPSHAPLHWTVHQPGTLEAFEETPIVPKIPGYVQKWNVDIGDPVKKGEVLAVLWVPDLMAELHQRDVEVQQARKMSEVAEAHLASSAAQVEEARAGLRRARANSQYWKMQYERITQLTESSVINKQVKEENWNRLESAEAGVKEAEAKVAHAEADARESEAVRRQEPGGHRRGPGGSGTNAVLGGLCDLVRPIRRRRHPAEYQHGRFRQAARRR